MSDDLVLIGRKTIRQEAEALVSFVESLDDSFSKACRRLMGCSGTVVLTGMGKSGLVARKWASTFLSTGTRAYFLNPAEASHGDLGLLRKSDVLVVLSLSGETEELIPVLRFAAESGVPCIAVTQNPESSLARQAETVLELRVREEACPLGLAPTTSTTLMMALGDALAVTLMQERGFSEKDFARLHPGGSLGRRLVLRVETLMHTGDKIPRVAPTAPLDEVLLEMTHKCLGLAVVLDGAQVHGVITDGDLRRAFQSNGPRRDLCAADVMTSNPRRVPQSLLASEARELMARESIQQLLVDSADGQLVGVVHLYDLLRAKVQ
ncbi:KpsF/GutQ family sugar-phosphate isomerase [bacterium]|nr:KpsF/GutQ family sugar-phosphate isomerase [bacterium]